MKSVSHFRFKVFWDLGKILPELEKQLVKTDVICLLIVASYLALSYASSVY